MIDTIGKLMKSPIGPQTNSHGIPERRDETTSARASRSAVVSDPWGQRRDDGAIECLALCSRPGGAVSLALRWGINE
jgi:hypothetical protein